MTDRFHRPLALLAKSQPMVWRSETPVRDWISWQKMALLRLAGTLIFFAAGFVFLWCLL